MLLKVMKFLKDERIYGVSGHDVINWFYNRIELCATRHVVRLQKSAELNGFGPTHEAHRLWVWTGNPNVRIIERDGLFSEKVRKLMPPASKRMLFESDIKDRFITGGKLWLVGADGSITNEEDVRIYPNKCNNCKLKVENGTLLERQDGVCTTCFLELLPESEHFNYIRSTLKVSLVHNGYRVHYDPISGRLLKVIYQSDLINRVRIALPG